MHRYVVLIDRESARIFSVSNAGVDIEKLRYAHPDHHTHHKNSEDRESGRFYEEVAGHVKDADELLVLGHGVGLPHFQHHLEAKHAALARKVLAYETVDRPTDAQIAAMARKYFIRADQMQGLL